MAAASGPKADQEAVVVDFGDGKWPPSRCTLFSSGWHQRGWLSFLARLGVWAARGVLLSLCASASMGFGAARYWRAMSNDAGAAEQDGFFIDVQRGTD